MELLMHRRLEVSPSVIALAGDRTGLYVHFDGHYTGRELERILQRDGSSAIPSLLSGRTGWAFIHSGVTEENTPLYPDEYLKVINHYGVRYDYLKRDRVSIRKARRDKNIEYLYLIDPDTLTVSTTKKTSENSFVGLLTGS